MEREDIKMEIKFRDFNTEIHLCHYAENEGSPIAFTLHVTRARQYINFMDFNEFKKIPVELLREFDRLQHKLDDMIMTEIINNKRED